MTTVSNEQLIKASKFHGKFVRVMEKNNQSRHPTMSVDWSPEFYLDQRRWMDLLPASPAELDAGVLNTEQLRKVRSMWMDQGLISCWVQACIEVVYVLGGTAEGGGWGFTQAAVSIKASDLTEQHGRIRVEVNGSLVMRYAFRYTAFEEENNKLGKYLDVGERIYANSGKQMANLFIPGGWVKPLMSTHQEADRQILRMMKASGDTDRDRLLNELDVEGKYVVKHIDD